MTLKESNPRAFNEIYINLEDAEIFNADTLSSEIKQIVYWQCSNNQEHIWASCVFERKSINEDKGCPFCLNEKVAPNGPKLIISEKAYNHKYTHIRNVWHCKDCKSIWETSGLTLFSYESSCINCLGEFNVPLLSEKYPKLIDEWDSTNILHSWEVNYEYFLPVKWKCKVCNQVWEATIFDKINDYKKCPYCNNKLPIADKTSLAALRPKLLSEWNWKINTRSPYKEFEDSKHMAYWTCSKCHMLYSVSIIDKVTKPDACPNCSSDNPISGKIYLKILDEVDASNDIDLDIIYPKYSIPLKWNCNNCGYIWTSSLYDRLLYNKKCPNCYHHYNVPSNSFLNNKRKSNSKISISNSNKEHSLFYDNHPELVSDWDISNEKNIYEINEIAGDYNLNIKWKCQTCNQIWSATINDRIYHAKDCPYCDETLPIPNRTSLAALNPHILDEWNWKKNSRSPYEVFEYDKYYVNWICNRCHINYKARIADKIKNINICPNCNSANPISSDKYDYIVSELVKTPNIDLDCIDTQSKVSLEWNCKECHNKWIASIYERLYDDKKCPYCSGKIAIPGKTSFKALHPILSKQFHTLNKEDPDYLLPTSTKTFKWRCDKCSMVWSSSIKERINDDKKCPYCSGKMAIPGKTSFKALHNNQMGRWDYISNVMLTNPDNIIEKYNKEVWWKCTICNSTYKMSPKRKLLYDKRGLEPCSYCKGYRRRKVHFF